MSDARRVVDQPPSTHHVTTTNYYTQSITQFLITQINKACISSSRHHNIIPVENATITTEKRQSGPFGTQKNIPSGNRNTYYPVTPPAAKSPYSILYLESFCTAGKIVKFTLSQIIKT
jgi:hypothetical protein